MKKTPRYAKFAMYLVAIVLINLVGMTLFFRVDLTRGKVYSLSEVSRTVVSTLKEPLTINVFFTRNLPAPYNGVEQYLKDLLAEYAMNSGAYFNYRFYDVSAEGEGSARTQENLKLAGNYGISPVQIQVVEKDEMKFKKAYMGLVIIHGDMVERIPTITATEGLEYKLTTTIQRLNNKISALLGLKDKITVRLYLSSSLEQVAPRMGIKDLPKVASDVKKLVEDMNTRMYGKLDYAFVDPSTEAEMTNLSKANNAVMLKWPALEGGKIPAGSGAIGLTVQHGDKSFMIPVLQAYQVPLFGTQYKLTELGTVENAMEQSIESLIGINETLGYLVDRGTIDPYGAQGSSPQSISNFSTLVSRSYSFKDISLKRDGIPEGLGSLLIVRPTEEFSAYELFQIDQALMKGTNLAIFLDPFREAPPSGSPYQQQGQLAPFSTGIEKLLGHYGIRVQQSYVLDENCFKQPLPEQFGGGEQSLYYAPVIESASINTSLPFMKNIKRLIALKTAPLALDEQRIKANRLQATRLFSSSDRSWEMKGMINLNPMLIKPPSSGEAMKSMPLAYILEGSFPSYFTGKPIPEKPQAETAAQAPGAAVPAAGQTAASGSRQLQRQGDFISVSKPAKIFLIGSAEMLTDNLISDQGDNPNATFIMNVIDVLNNREDTALMRSKVQSFNPLTVKDEKAKILAKGFNIAGLPVIVVIAGLLVWFRRLTRKRRIEAMFQGQR
ncbi:MAG: Gldg family protein [Syntrophaceae bacterium]|nr:Gldg family protein [Deltaproteobacteria bacterium]